MILPVFKTGARHLRGVEGVFDSHTLPPDFLEDRAGVEPAMRALQARALATWRPVLGRMETPAAADFEVSTVRGSEWVSASDLIHPLATANGTDQSSLRRASQSAAAAASFFLVKYQSVTSTPLPFEATRFSASACVIGAGTMTASPGLQFAGSAHAF